MRKIFLLPVLFVTCATAPSDSAKLAYNDSILPTETEKYVPKLSLEGPVDEVSVTQLEILFSGVEAAGAKAIVLEINSPGGYIHEGFKLMKIIESSSVPVICVVDGDAASMAFAILQSCDLRLMTKRSVLMAHGPAIRGGFKEGGTKNDWDNVSEALRVKSNALVEHMCARMLVTPEEFRARISDGKDWWFDWQDAVKFGAVDMTVESVNGLLVDLRGSVVLEGPAKL